MPPIAKQVRSMATDTGLFLLARIAWIIEAIGIGIPVASYLGPNQLGTLNYAIAFTAIICTISMLNPTSLVVKRLVSAPEQRNSTLGILLKLRLALLTCAILLGILFVLAARQPSQTSLLCLLCASSCVWELGDILRIHYNAIERSRHIAYSQLLSCLIHSTIRITAMLCHWSLTSFALAEVFACAVKNLYLLVIYHFHGNSVLRWQGSWQEAWLLFKEGLPLSLSAMLAIVYAKTDVIMLKLLTTAESAGNYSLASRMAENWSLCSTIVLFVLFPKIVKAYAESTRAYSLALHRMYFLLFWGMCAVSAITILLARPFILLLFGAQYTPAILALRLYCPMLPFQAILMTFDYQATNEGHLLFNALVMSFSVLLNITANFILIPCLGLNGAAIATLLSTSLSCVIPFLFTQYGRSSLRFILRCMLPHGLNLTNLIFPSSSR